MVSWIVSLLLIFHRTLWIFACLFRRINTNFTYCLVFNISKHFSVYLCLSIMATPLPLSCFIITILSLLERFSTILLHSYGTLTLLYFSYVLRSFVLIKLILFLEYVICSLINFDKKLRIQF